MSAMPSLEAPPRCAGSILAGSWSFDYDYHKLPAKMPALPGEEPVKEHDASNVHKGWHSRGYLPHFDQPGLLQSITFRLHDAVPLSILNDWQIELDCIQKRPATDPRAVELRRRIDRYEDSHHGACWLRQPMIAEMVEETLLHFEGERYHLHAWCIMPNHVHVLVELQDDWALDSILHTWKSYSAQQANKILKRKGAFWFREYADRYIRDREHYLKAVHYIEGNPVTASLTDYVDTWPFSSARRRPPSSSEAPAP